MPRTVFAKAPGDLVIFEEQGFIAWLFCAVTEARNEPHSSSTK